MAELDRRLAEIASRQHSLVSLTDVIEAGGTRSQASDRVLGGRWEAVRPGVFRLTGVPWSYEAKVMAAVLAGGPDAVASHLCAARLLGIGFRTAAPEISVPRGRNHRPTGVRVHQSTDLRRCSVHERHGIPVTDPARTLLDVGRYVGAGALRRAVEEARRQQLVTWTELISCLARHARKGRHGVRRLRLVITSGMAIDEVTDTDSELLALTLLREHGLPQPVLHHRVRDADGDLRAEIDLAHPDRRVGFEIDGTVHLDPGVKAKDDARDHWLRQQGWTIRRIWWEIPVRQPGRFLEIVRSTLADAPVVDPPS